MKSLTDQVSLTYIWGPYYKGFDAFNKNLAKLELLLRNE